MLVPLLLTLFIGLKLTNHIDWDWTWVLVPLWGPIAFAAIVFLIALLLAMIFGNQKGMHFIRRFFGLFIKKFRR